MTSKIKFAAVAFLFVAACSGQASGPAGGSEEAQKRHCVDNVLCILGSHWDSHQCKCVPDVCVDNVLCIVGDHWDATQCKCVPTLCGPDAPGHATCPDGSYCKIAIDIGQCTPNPTCDAGQTACYGTCVDTSSDAQNCGACNTVCTADQSCSQGACVSNNPDAGLCTSTGGSYGFVCGCGPASCSQSTPPQICPQICRQACTCADGNVWDDVNGFGCIPPYFC